MVVVEVAHLFEELRLVPYLRKGLLLDVAGLFLEEPADLDLADVGYESKALAAHAALGHGVETMGLGRDGLALFLFTLPEDAIVVGRAGRLELDGNLVAHLIEPLERALVFLGRDLLVRELLAAACGHEQEWMVGHGAELDHHLEQLGQILYVVFRDRGVHLELHADLFEVLDGLHHTFERAFHTTEGIVALCVQTVDRERHAHDAGVLDLLRQLLGDEQAAGRHDHAQPELGAVLGDIVDVLAHHRLAAGEDDDGVAEGLDVVEEAIARLRVKLARIGPVLGRGPAVDAVQDTAPRHLPGNKPREIFLFLRHVCGMAVAVGGFGCLRVGHKCSFIENWKLKIEK